MGQAELGGCGGPSSSGVPVALWVTGSAPAGAVCQHPLPLPRPLLPPGPGAAARGGPRGHPHHVHPQGESLPQGPPALPGSAPLAPSPLQPRLSPQVSVWGTGQAWRQAATQVFFALGLGFGSVIAYASYGARRSDCHRDAVLVAGLNALTSLLATLVVFAVLGARATRRTQHCLRRWGGGGCPMVGVPAQRWGPTPGCCTRRGTPVSLWQHRHSPCLAPSPQECRAGVASAGGRGAARDRPPPWEPHGPASPPVQRLAVGAAPSPAGCPGCHRLPPGGGDEQGDAGDKLDTPWGWGPPNCTPSSNLSYIPPQLVAQLGPGGSHPIPWVIPPQTGRGVALAPSSIPKLG